MKKFTKEIKGSIALFLSLIMLFLVILEGFLIDGSKALAAQTIMSSAGDMAMNAGLTYYDDALRKVYGLFAVSKTEEDLTKNLQKYYKETLGDVTGTENTTGYTDQMLQYISKSISGGWNEEEAGKLLNMSLSSFHASGLENSTLANEYVIKEQILEYMKYRGPASIGYGMLEKIFAFKDLNKQNKAVEAKLTYEETMSDIQQACQDAYDCILQYQKLLEQLKPDLMEKESDAINQDIYQVTELVFAYDVVKQKPERNGNEFDANWQKKTSRTDYDVEQQYANHCQANFEKLYEIYSRGSSSFSDNLRSSDWKLHLKAAMQAVLLTDGYMEGYSAYQDLYTVWKNWHTQYVKEKKQLEKAIAEAEKAEEDTTALEEELDELEETNDDYEKIIEGDESVEYPGVTTILGSDMHSGVIAARDAAAAILSDDIDKYMKDAGDRIQTIKENAENAEKLAISVKDSLQTVMDKMGDLKANGEKWQEAIGGLAEGTVRTSMQADYDNKSKELDETKIRALMTYMDHGMEYFQVLINELDPVRIMTFPVKDVMSGSSYALKLQNKWKNSIYASTTKPYASSPFSWSDSFVEEWLENCRNTEALTDPGVTFYYVDAFGGQAGSGGADLWPKMDLKTYKDKWNQIDPKDDEFYKYLERTCQKRETEEEDKNNAETAKNSLFDQGKINYETEGISSNKMDGDGDSHGFDEPESGKSNKELSSNAKKNNKETSNFLESVGSLLEKGRDKLYISEYATKMFSYYTVDLPKDASGNPQMKKTLSGYEFSDKSNYLYKAEVEYILWGNADPKKDVEYTLALIFGIRFLLNTIYAFTGDPEIRSTSLSLAVSIAGWTGFGVPLVQSVIILGFALAESALDLNALKEGKSIPIYKSVRTWVVKPSGVGTAFKEQLGNLVNQGVKEAENALFDQLNKLTKESVGKLNQSLTDYGKAKVDDVVETATAAVLTPVQERLIGLVNVLDQGKSSVSEGINQALAGVRNSIDEEPDSVLKKAKIAAVEYMQNGGVDQIIQQVNSVQNANGLSAKDITERINGAVTSCRTNLKNKLTGMVTSEINSLTTELQNSIDASSKELQKDVNDKVDQYLMRIDCGISFSNLPDGGAGTTKTASKPSDALTMDYSEYLWLFIAVKSIGENGETNMLQRIGKLIGKNMVMKDNPNKSSNENFSISSAYTMIGVEADVNLKTTFFALPLPGITSDGKAMGADQSTLHYRGALGY